MLKIMGWGFLEFYTLPNIFFSYLQYDIVGNHPPVVIDLEFIFLRDKAGILPNFALKF